MEQVLLYVESFSDCFLCNFLLKRKGFSYKRLIIFNWIKIPVSLSKTILYQKAYYLSLESRKTLWSPESFQYHKFNFCSKNRRSSLQVTKYLNSHLDGPVNKSFVQLFFSYSFEKILPQKISICFYLIQYSLFQLIFPNCWSVELLFLL